MHVQRTDGRRSVALICVGRSWAAAAALSVSMLGAAHASTITFDWVTPTGLQTPGSAPLTGTVVLTGALPSITSSTFTGTLTGTLQSFSLAEGGLTLASGPTGSSWTVTNGILAPFTDGSITYAFSDSVLTNSYSLTATATTDSVLSLNTLTGNAAVGPLLSTYLKGSNELAFFGSGSASLSGKLVPLTETLAATGTGAGYLGYWQIQATPVPLPAALPLLLSGLGLLGVGRSRRSA